MSRQPAPNKCDTESWEFDDRDWNRPEYRCFYVARKAAGVSGHAPEIRGDLANLIFVDHGIPSELSASGFLGRRSLAARSVFAVLAGPPAVRAFAVFASRTICAIRKASQPTYAAIFSTSCRNPTASSLGLRHRNSRFICVRSQLSRFARSAWTRPARFRSRESKWPRKNGSSRAFSPAR